MKRILLVFFYLCILISAGAKRIVYPDLFQMPILFDGGRIPNVKPIQGNYLYMAQSELSNLQYREFLYWLKQNNPEKYASSVLDSTVFGEKMTQFCISYYNNSAYNHFPVFGISQIQAVAYCDWLHDRLKETFKREGIPVESFIVRLPTEKEWMHAARGGLSSTSIYPWNHEDVRYRGSKRKDFGKFLLNCRMGVFSYENTKPYLSHYTTEALSYWPNEFGLYNMCGNVGEWLSEEGKSKGGSWRMPPYNCRIDAEAFEQDSKKARNDIGMRYVIEILKVKDSKLVQTYNMDKKSFNKTFYYIPIKDSKHMIFMSNEIDNYWYKQFLLEKSEQSNALNALVWDKSFPYPYFQMYSWHSGFDNYPAVGMSYQAALEFCDWLNTKYDAMDKKPYSKVKFRLPSESEWEYAASGGKKANYPWKGSYVRNSRGCLLANFSMLDERYMALDSSGQVKWTVTDDDIKDKVLDGALIPSFVYSYFPNDFGLYNCSGNVSEMVAEEGVSKGGSWLSNQFEIMIISKGKYTEPSNDLGFRVLAEVVEK
ncbi:MAG: SUMF1/EgtB/PvdO family nonheme iron enzyme [Bacteroidia bacterium]